MAISYNAYLKEFHNAKSNFAAMKHSFFLKDYKNKNGKSQIYLNLYIHQQRKKIPLEIYIPKKYWNQHKQEIQKSCENAVDYNLILNDIKARINKIEIQFRLSEQVLTVDKCAELLKRPDLTIDFVSFIENELSLKNM
ncbi:MAG: Arm DNA-binding domain-containing protein, partial [Flavobacteriaceae bacterium]|nr:Arm DNA-binding domain-containing protein [Flavobacteriaceae bacterium]